MVMTSLDPFIQNLDEVKASHSQELARLDLYQRTANYLSAAQLYLQDNFFLKEPLLPEQIKPRLLGHWGTCPGINLIYSHLNRLIIQNNLDMFLVTGPGHGAPANLANLYLEGSLQEFYPDLTLNRKGLSHFIKRFSWTEGFPSHLYPGIPGVIHEGGELGYALSTAFGAAMDNPDLIVACIVGDGEAETGPTAAAWHSYKFLDPAESGAVLPIVHINGYKISNPTIFGTMSDAELIDLFSGYGYHPVIISPPELNAGLYSAMDWAYREIRSIQGAARSDNRILKPRWPVILLRSPKGMGGIRHLNGVDIEGNCLSHQVPASDLKTNPESLKSVEVWLKSYRPEELFDAEGRPLPEVLQMCPKGNRRMGMNPHTFGGNKLLDLSPQDIFNFEIKVEKRGQTQASNIKNLAKYLSKVILDNPKTFRIFSPDELESNKLNVFDVTDRDYQWPLQAHDKHLSPNNGRVLEILSEHTLQGWMQGYTLTGRHGIFPSYEAFIGIVSTMMDQYAKFIKSSLEISWRKPVPSLNYLSTSTHWRQEHNGFSHQNPGFINTLLNKKGETIRIYLPPDANCLVSTIDHCFRSKNYVNYIIATKQEMPQWLTMEEAIAHCRAGASIWRWASTEEGINPDVVLVGIGDEPTVEVMAAAQMLRKELTHLRLRVVNVTDLLVLEQNSKHPHGMDQEMFEALLTKDCPVIFNFHGYPSALHQLLFNRGDTHRFYINGYREEGTTTTPFDMAIRNGIDRFHLMIQTIRLAAPRNPSIAGYANEKISFLEYVIRDHRRYILAHNQDPDQILNWKWNS